MVKFLKISLPIITAVGAFASLFWFLSMWFGARGHVNAAGGYGQIIYTLFFWIPTILITIFLTICQTTKLIKRKAIFVLSCVFALPLAFMSFMLIINTPIRGWLYEDVVRSVPSITEDDRYRYELRLINRLSRNRHARLYVTDLETDTEVVITIPFTSYNFGQRRSGAYITMTPTDTPNQFIARTTNALSRNCYESFIIDIESRTAVRLLKEIPYRSFSTNIEAYWWERYRFRLYLTETYYEGERIDTEAKLLIMEYSNGIYEENRLISLRPLNNFWLNNQVRNITPLHRTEEYLDCGKSVVTREMYIERGLVVQLITRQRNHMDDWASVSHLSNSRSHTFNCDIVLFYQEGERVNAEVRLIATDRQVLEDGLNTQQQSILLPINEEILINVDTARPLEFVQWFTITPTEHPHRFILQTNENFLGDTAYTLLIDLESGTVDMLMVQS